MPATEAQRAERWLLWEIPRYDGCTELQLFQSQERFDRAAISMGLTRLRRRGLAEKQGRHGGRPGLWRLTPRGALLLEEREWRQVAYDKQVGP